MPFQKPSLARSVVRSALFLTLLSCAESVVRDTDLGTECSATDPCPGVSVCVASWPGGYCTRPCGTGGAGCAPDGICEPALGDLCVLECETDGECRDGYECWRSACRPACTVDTDCGAGAVCDAGSCTESCTGDGDCSAGSTCIFGRCVMGTDAGPPPDGGGTVPLGEACTRTEECFVGVCLPADRGGFCTLPCGDFNECASSVPFGSTCGAATVDGTTGTFCLRYVDAAGINGTPCASDAECGSQTCSSGLCTEGCNDAADCEGGWSCGSSSWGPGTISVCAWPPIAGTTIAEVELRRASLGAMMITPTIPMVVPPDSVSTTLLTEVVGGDSLPITFYEVVAPGAFEIYSINELGMLIDQHVRWIPGNDYEAIGMLIPNGSPGRMVGGESWSYEPGRYTFNVAAYERMAGDTGAADVRVSALVKRVPGGVVTSGTLDLAVHLVGVGISASAAPTNTRVQTFLTRLDALLSAIGIRLGTISYHDVGTASLAVIDSTDGPTSELAQLFRMSAGRTGNVASIFLVRGVNGGGGGFNTLGVAGGIPGPAGIHGSMSSGVVVAFDAGSIGANTAGHIAAHELSHFLGLFHVTEQNSPCTGTMVPPACAPFGATDTISDTTRGDNSNLMNWSIVGSGTNTTITAGQAYVLLRSPLVR